MAKNILILGKSGSGKSASLRNFKDDEIFLINTIGKELPFKNSFKYKLNSDNYVTIKSQMLAATTKSRIKIIVLDDSGYLITNEFMRGGTTRKGNAVFELYNQLANNFWSLINFVRDELPQDVIVYFIMHEDTDENGNIQPKTIGKMLNDKICIQGMFTIVFQSFRNEGKYLFKTQSDTLGIAKTPMNMFEEKEIDNDLKMINEKIKLYYEGE